MCAPMSKECAGGSADPARHHGLLRPHTALRMCSVCPSWVSMLLVLPAEATLLCFALSDFGRGSGPLQYYQPFIPQCACGRELYMCVYIALSSVKS